MLKFTFSREVRLGELTTAAAVIIGGVSVWTNINAKVAQIEQAQAVQVQTNREIRQEIREVSVDMKQEFRALRSEMRPRSAGQM